MRKAHTRTLRSGKRVRVRSGLSRRTSVRATFARQARQARWASGVGGQPSSVAGAARKTQKRRYTLQPATRSDPYGSW